MSTINVDLSIIPAYNNPQINKNLYGIFRDSLLGMILAAIGFIGRDNLNHYFRVYDRSSRRLNLIDLVDNSDIDLLDTDVADITYLPPELGGWLATLAQYNVIPTKRYTAVIYFPYLHIVVQYSNPEFLDGVEMFMSWLHVSPEDYIREIYDRNTRIN